MYDLLLKGGTVLDPSAGLAGVHDVAVQGGLIARIASDIAVTESARTIEVTGRIVTPGLIDLHAHVFEGFARNGLNPDLGGVYAGVTTIVDAGSAGAATFGGFPRHILPRCHTEIIPFLHICQTGLATSPDIIAETSVDLDDTLRVLDEYKGLICGIKARMVSPALEIMGMEMPKLARRAARESGTRLMVHIGDTEKRYDPTVIRKLLPLLEEGDILTHYLTAPGRLMTVHSMTEIMTRFLGLGFTLPQVVTMSTANPAKAIGADKRLGNLAVGRQADISVLELREGAWEVYDVLGSGLRVNRAFTPHLTV